MMHRKTSFREDIVRLLTVSHSLNGGRPISRPFSDHGMFKNHEPDMTLNPKSLTLKALNR